MLSHPSQVTWFLPFCSCEQPSSEYMFCTTSHPFSVTCVCFFSVRFIVRCVFPVYLARHALEYLRFSSSAHHVLRFTRLLHGTLYLFLRDMFYPRWHGMRYPYCPHHPFPSHPFRGHALRHNASVFL